MPTNQNPIPRIQKALATTLSRGLTLFRSDGYTIELYPGRPGVYSVARGEDDERPLQKLCTIWNDVNVFEQTCTCRGFLFRRTCKHLIAVNAAIAQASRLVPPPGKPSR